jgi:hypothetical protein
MYRLFRHLPFDSRGVTTRGVAALAQGKPWPAARGVRSANILTVARVTVKQQSHASARFAQGN